MGGLGEEVEGAEGARLVAGGGQVGEVAGEGSGVAGEVDEAGRAFGGEGLAHGLFEARSGRIDEGEVGGGKAACEIASRLGAARDDFDRLCPLGAGQVRA